MDKKPAAIEMEKRNDSVEKDKIESNEGGDLVSLSEQSNEIKETNEDDNQSVLKIFTEMHDNVIKVIVQGKHNELSVDLLTKWVEREIIMYVVNKQFTGHTENVIKNTFYTYINNDFKKVKISLKQCSVTR